MRLKKQPDRTLTLYFIQVFK